MVSLSDIRSFFRGSISINQPLAGYTSMRVGGPVDYFVEPADKDDLVAIAKYFRTNDFDFIMVGRGSNILVSDEGFRGAAINLEGNLSGIRLENGDVIAEAGAGLSKLVDFCIQNGKAGLEWAAGIPGTVGGAIVMNAGAHGGETADRLVEIEVLRGNEVVVIPKSSVNFGYRRSGLGDDIVLAGRFNLPDGDRDELNQRRRTFIQQRNASQPVNMPNSGSIFKNPPGNYAARLIDAANLKGKRVGGAQISEKHANFIINTGNATASDALTLVDLARRTVYQNAGILLELELRLIGFPDDVQGKVS